MNLEIDGILDKRDFTKEEIIYLLSLKGADAVKLMDKALEVKLKYLDNYVRLRGLIEYSNKCIKN